MELPDFAVLFLDRFDQQRRQSSVVHALCIDAVRLHQHDLWNDGVNVLGNQADVVAAAVFPVIGHALELFYFREGRSSA